MLYTVKEVSDLSGVTIKTLHHYHKIGLLKPQDISEAGYRLYGERELERLQEILFYRELELPLAQIQSLLEEERKRGDILAEQRELLRSRKRRLDSILQTLEKSIESTASGEELTGEELFVGFADEAEWREALREQEDYLSQTYGVEVPGPQPIDVPELNEQAKEAMEFTIKMVEALRSGISHQDEGIRHFIDDHLAFMKKHDHPATPADFAAQARFFLSDEFHRAMLEGQQTGLAYYLLAAAEAYAANSPEVGKDR
ncbi:MULTISPECIES: MerR family transcriptional regulator [Paenibacillus]|jgi:DNA-binding transcriptional MerR regulator|uniref:MerR family transcriptional regulator n=1 Tax=Paenibacillus TaxID=44249 RepID=UPI001B18D89E|nr:MerR family transcriptional regulator [Paenibacillus sp. J53TS2]GIP49427.1 MerR family transcriptional regulator [Paenibacillus sp. J53TS2]